jgi:hypothetical protein
MLYNTNKGEGPIGGALAAATVGATAVAAEALVPRVMGVRPWAVVSILVGLGLRRASVLSAGSALLGEDLASLALGAGAAAPAVTP